MGAGASDFLKVEIGADVGHRGKAYRITHLLAIDRVLAVDRGNGESVSLRVDELTAVAPTDSAPFKDLTKIPEKDWEIAQKRMEWIRALLSRPGRTRADVVDAAKAAGVSTASLYRWLMLYERVGHVSALVPQKRGREQGTKLLTKPQEALITAVIEEMYLSKQRHTLSDISKEVVGRCRLAGISAPSEGSIRRRIRELDEAKVTRARGRPDLARNRYEPIRGEFPHADHALAVVEIDHSPADVMLVGQDRLPLARPWVTLAIDVHTRMVAGVYITFEKPSAVSVAMCLSRAICTKGDYLRSIKVEGNWPIWGVMKVVHMDNAREFRSVALERAANNLGIELQWRPAGKPNFGGHIERLMGSVANQARKLPGATFANVLARRGYDADKESAMTIDEFETDFVDWIVNEYHQGLHKGINMNPQRKLMLSVGGSEDAPGTGVPPIPSNPRSIELSFMPSEERTIQAYGVQIEKIHYYDPILDPYINRRDPEDHRKKRKFVFRYDPRNMDTIYFTEPTTGEFVPIPYRTRTNPPASRWELQQAQRQLREDGKKEIDEAMIFQSVLRRRERRAESLAKTKSARREVERLKRAGVLGKTAKTTAESVPSAQQTSAAPASTVPDWQVYASVSATVDADDPFTMEVRPFDD